MFVERNKCIIYICNNFCNNKDKVNFFFEIFLNKICYLNNSVYEIYSGVNKFFNDCFIKSIYVF